MKTAMREAFESVQVPTRGAQSPIVRQIVRVANRQDQRRAAAKKAKAAAKAKQNG